MKGILIISHLNMAKGIYETAKLFLGEDVESFDYLGLEPDFELDSYESLMKDKIKKLDSGDGVIIFADIYGGTPCNRALKNLNDDILLISGVNLPMILETAFNRDGKILARDIIKNGTKAILDVKEALLEFSDTEFDED